MRYLLLLLIPLLFACEERFRYPCQDPEHWDDKQCKKPYCSANGTCPEDLAHYEKSKVGQPAGGQQIQQQVPAKGDCK
jgi:hypothetical protein